jgi:hypothetical protein
MAVHVEVDRCAICGQELLERSYTVTDKLTEEKKRICGSCAELPHDCFICGLPVKDVFTELPDGRFLCARDGKTAILDEQAAELLVAQVKDALDRLFSRFLTFPETNVVTRVVDRVNLLELFKIPGNDYECPNVLGYIQSSTNRSVIKHTISLLGGLPRAQFKSVIAHEYSHAWVFDFVPAARQKALGRDAHEGFCELVAYLLMNSQDESDQMKMIVRNRYTRGQIDFFIEAERRFGFNEIVEWMKYGVDPLLLKDELHKVRHVVMPSPESPQKKTDKFYAATEPLPDAPNLVLKGILWAEGRPLALINNQTFAAQEQRRVRVGGTNELVRCLTIGKDTVRVTIVGSGKEEDLTLGTP